MPRALWGFKRGGTAMWMSETNSMASVEGGRERQMMWIGGVRLDRVGSIVGWEALSMRWWRERDRGWSTASEGDERFFGGGAGRCGS